jgi:hypothetical protein
MFDTQPLPENTDLAMYVPMGLVLVGEGETWGARREVGRDRARWTQLS